MTGHPTEALGFGQSAQALAESLGDVPLQVTGNLYLGAGLPRDGATIDGPRIFFRKVLELA